VLQLLFSTTLTLTLHHSDVIVVSSYDIHLPNGFSDSADICT